MILISVWELLIRYTAVMLNYGLEASVFEGLPIACSTMSERIKI